MPRIRPLRTKEEIAKVPQDQPVTIALEPEGTVEIETPEKETTEPQKKEKRVREVPEVRENQEVMSLKRQLEDMQKASDLQRIQAHEAIQEANRRAQENEQRFYNSYAQAQDAEYQAILNAIGAAEGEAEGAQELIARASEASDPKAVAEASRKLARAESRLAQLEDGKAALEAQKTREAAQAKAYREQQREQPKQQPQPQSPEQYIDQMPNLLPSQRDWLKAHPETITNTNKNLRLQGAHAEAVDLNMKPGTQKYFDHLEMRMGYGKPSQEEGEEDMEDESSQIVSAPPSRQATSPTGKSTTTKITLTPEQREVARLSGISEIDYARGLQRLNDMKANGGYQ
jgi:hypothetical protein